MNPISQFNAWLAEAAAHPQITEPTAMTLATATPDGRPSARIVLLKQCDAEGFLFYTNHTSRKSLELTANPQAALCFYWMPLGRQVRVEGTIVASTDDEADAYFHSRPRARQIGAWASLQSQAMDDRAQLERRVAAVAQEYEGRAVPRPPHWSGWRLVPERIEFWTASDERLHVRDLYSRVGDSAWQHALLYP